MQVYLVTENVPWEWTEVVEAFASLAGAEKYVAEWNTANPKTHGKYVTIIEMEVTPDSVQK